MPALGSPRPNSHRTCRALAGLLVGVLGFAGCGAADASAFHEMCTGGEEGVTLAANTGSGEWVRQRRSPRWVELWRAGGTYEGQHLALPTWLSVSADGRLAIPDFNLLEAVLIEPDGTWRGAIGRHGSGPGELQSAVAAGWTGAGEVQVLDVPGAKLEIFGPGGESVRRLPIERSFIIPVFEGSQIGWAAVGEDGSVFLQGGIDGVGNGREFARSAILRLAPGASVADTVVDHEFPVVMTEGWERIPAPGWPRPLAAVGPGGRMAVSDPEGRYRIRVRRIAEPDLIVCRDAPGIPLQPAELGSSADTSFAVVSNAFRGAPRPPDPAAYGRFFLSAEGRLWVHRERPVFPHISMHFGNPGATWDVFDADGSFLGEIRAPEGARLQGAMGDTAYGFEIGELDEIWVVAYRLELE